MVFWGKARLSCQKDEHDRRDIFRRLGVAGLSQRGEIHQVHMTRQQRRKRVVGVPRGVLPQRFRVSQIVHLLIYVR